MQLFRQQCRVEEALERFTDALDRMVDPRWPEKVRDVLHDVHAHLFDETLSAGRVLARCGVCSNTFAGAFRHHLHVSLRRYVEERRMMAALRLFWQTGCSLETIALAVGYSDYRCFARAFTRCMGCCPRAFRDALPLEEDVAVAFDGVDATEPHVAEVAA